MFVEYYIISLWSECQPKVGARPEEICFGHGPTISYKCARPGPGAHCPLLIRQNLSNMILANGYD